MEYSKQFKCGLNTDKPDERDFMASAKIVQDIKLPPSVSFIDRMPHIRNQGNLGACASFAFTHIAAAFEDNKTDFSPLFTYYFTRFFENGIENICEDSGSTLRGVLKASNKVGWTTESLWRYDVNKFAVKPSELAQGNARGNIAEFKAIYYRATTADEIKIGMALGYLPFIGVVVTDSFYSDDCMRSGVIPLPDGKEYGGHALVISAYDDNKSQFTIENSWGEDVGDKGRFYLPYDVLPQIMTDCWLCKIVCVGDTLEENS